MASKADLQAFTRQVNDSLDHQTVILIGFAILLAAIGLLWNSARD